MIPLKHTNIRHAAVNFIRNIKLMGYVSDVHSLQLMGFIAMNTVFQQNAIQPKWLKNVSVNGMNEDLYLNTENRIIFAFIAEHPSKINSIMGELAMLVQRSCQNIL